MTEKLAFIVFAALPISPTILVVALLVVAVVILVGAILLFRNPGKKKTAKTDAAGWQPQGQQQGTPGAWNQQGMGGAADNQWNQQQQGNWGTPNASQQQPGAWGAPSSPQQPQAGSWGTPAQPGGWGPQAPQPADNWGAMNAGQQAGSGFNAQAPTQQPASSTWGAPSQPQQPNAWGTAGGGQQPAAWNNSTPNTPSAGASGNQNSWDATFLPQQSAAGSQDAWGQQPQAAPMQQGQGAPVWGMPNSNSSQPQAPTAYGGSGAGQQPWGQSSQSASAEPWSMPSGQQAASAQPGWAQPGQPPVSSTPSIGAGVPSAPSWQQGQGSGTSTPASGGFGSSGAAMSFNNSDNDKTMLRPNNPLVPLGIVRVEEGKEPGRVYEVRKDELSIGRSRESDIFLEDLAVSRLHAKIVSLGNGNYALKDEGSANGTKVNGQLVNKYQTYPLQEGDKIQLGQTVLVFARR